MRNNETAGSVRRSLLRLGLRMSPLALACSALLFGTAHAQSAAQDPAQAAPQADEAAAKKKSEEAAAAKASKPVEELSQVDVKGIAASLQGSIAAKRNSDSIVEAVTAEDIGKLPDLSIADSIARLPGLAAQRVEGRAQVISIRGMAPDFAVSLLNGRELVSPGDNRGVEYDQYPAELINAVTVYKTPDASLAAQGLSGTIDMQTLRPLDLSSRFLAVNVRAENNSNGVLNAHTKDSGERVNFTYADKFLDNTLGVAVGFAHLNSPWQTRRFNTWGYDNDNSLPPGNENVYKVSGAESYGQSLQLKRDSLMGVVQYKPNEVFESTVDLYYSRFKQEETIRSLMYSIGPSWDGTAIVDPVIAPFPHSDLSLITDGTLTGVHGIINANYNTRRDKQYQFGWNNVLNLGAWKLTGDLSYSQVTSKLSELESYSGGPVDNDLQFHIPFGSAFPTFKLGYDYTDPNVVKLSDPGVWGQDAFLRLPLTNDRMGSARLSAQRQLDVPVFNEIEFGVNYSDRKKTHHTTAYQYFLKDDRAPVSVSPDLIERPTSLSFTGIPGVLSYDILGVLHKYYDVGPDPDPQRDNYLRNYSVREKLTTFYGKLNIDTAVASVPVRGNVGLQLVRTDQSSLGHDLGDPLRTIERGATYVEPLPSLNLIFDLGHFSDGLEARFGLARTAARPRMDDLRASQAGAVDPISKLWSGAAGNSQLRPWIATSWDLSFEKYFDRESYVAAAFFYKDLKNYIYTSQKYIDFEKAGFVNYTPVVPLSPMGVLSTPVNGTGGTVHGIELSATLAGRTLTDWLDGFGLTGSISDTQSSIASLGPGTSASLPGLSGQVRSVVAYYEKYGFSARIGQTYRSAFRAESMGPHGLMISTELMADRVTDLQLGYEFGKGRFDGLSLMLEVSNLTNSPYRTRYIGIINSNMDAVGEYQKYGRQVLFGANYKF